jgi:PAS domain S-box-containing protein
MLRDYNLPFRDLIDAAPDGIVVCDQAGTLVLVNAEAERMFGYARDELVGKSIELLIPERIRPHHGHHLSSYVSAPRLRPMGSEVDLRGLRKDGTEFPVEISLSPVRTERGLVITAGIRDVTDRRRLERDHRRTSAALSSAVEAAQDAFTLFDEQDRVMTVNSTARQLLGSATGGSIVGWRFDELLRSALSSGVFDFSNETQDALFERWMAYHRDPQGVLEVRTGTGRYLRVSERRTAEHGTVSTIADVTGDVERAAELESARQAAEAASAAKSEFLSSMSHELRTPLNAILGFAQLLEHDRRRPLDDRQLERLGHVLRGGEHLLKLIDDVLDLSRIEARRISVSTEPLDITTLINEVAETLQPMAARAKIQVATAPLPPALPQVVADRTRTSQILMNFGSNAIKYGKPGGHLTFRVTASVSAERLRVAVVDDGIGIPADKRAKIFDPFQRAGQETGPIEGTGIGLTISKRLAELMHADIGFTSEVDHGSEFWLELPVLQQPAAPTHAASTAATAPPGLVKGTARHTVVYVEDNPSNIAFMREFIADLGTIELLIASTAEVGLELIRERQPKLVIMDINLPGISGFEAVKRLRAEPSTRDIPVVALSAAALVKDTSRAKDAGFYRYLTKPVKVAELMAVLEELLVPTT